MLKLRSRLIPVIVPAMLVLLVAAVACEPVEQQKLSRDEIRQVVRVEVNSQVEAAKQQMSQEFEPFKGDMEFQLMQPLNELRFEFDALRNQVEGTEYVSKFDLESLRLDMQEMGSYINSLEFEYARRTDLDELRFQIDDINNNMALRDLESNQSSDIAQLWLGIEETQAMIEDERNQSNLNLDQLRLEIQNLERFLNDFQANFNFELDTLRLRVDSIQ